MMNTELINIFTKILADEYLTKQLKNAVTSSYCRQTTTQEKNLVFDAFDIITEKQNYRNYSCNNCIFRAFSRVAPLFFKWAEEAAEKAKENEVIKTPENNTETVEATVTEPKKTVKKSTTKKKSTKKTAAKKR